MRVPLSARVWGVAAGVAAPALRLMLRRRVARGREVAGRLAERRGVEAAPRPEGVLLWVHAASVGETASVMPVLAALPGWVSVLLTTATVTGGALAERRFAELGLAGRMVHRFAPLDVPAWGARFLAHWRPDAAAFVESELWPNLLGACRARGIPTALVNGRLSERSARGWGRAPGLARHVLSGFALVGAQSEEDAARLRGLGARDVGVPGNLKYAAPPLPVDEAALAGMREALGGRPAWLAASTHPGEEAVVLAVHRVLAAGHPGVVTIVAPRHPDRGEEVARALAAAEGGVVVARHGAGEGPPAEGGVWVFDALGELGTLFALAGVVVMGNSLAGEGGGHNPLEPARAGCAVATGPLVANFTAVVARLREAGGLHVADGPEALAAWVDAMLRDPVARGAAGEAGRRAADAYAGLPGETAAALLRLLPAGAAG
ncbi:MAG: 3-deoxy-D-manno-octulosonic acid transferase [Janthinobacterium lividum]